MGQMRPAPEEGEIVYLGLGSNLGDRESNLRRALDMLGESVAIRTISSIYETEPWGYENQPAFLNCACGGVTSLDPQGLLAAVKEVERRIGREPTFPNGPRSIDVDILLFGQRVVLEPGLEIPHPRLHERAFVLVPLAQIAGSYRHPVKKETVAELLLSIGRTKGSVDGLPSGVTLWAPQTRVSGQV